MKKTEGNYENFQNQIQEIQSWKKKTIIILKREKKS